jgi:hypothetical protein
VPEGVPETRLPTEVELVYEVMPCNALRTAQEPTDHPHPCTYFRKWGTYHSYDYVVEGPPPTRGIEQPTKYVGRAPVLPEILSGCRKAPIMALGINPNLPGWWAHKRRWLAPLFDDYKQYAHYFRYRATAKLELTEADYERFGGGDHDTPFSDFVLQVPPDANGDRIVSAQLQPQTMYETYQSLLDALAQEMGWPAGKLVVGEDLTYGNMVATPSAKWTTVPDPRDPKLPPMTEDERNGIVGECFRKRKYFLRQLFQSLPNVLLIFSQSTANAFVAELAERFTSGDPKPGEPLHELMEREVRLEYGELPDGTSLEARVIFSPHITGNPAEFAAAKKHVVGQLVEEARANRLHFNAATGHLARPVGSCVFCPMLEIGPCDYVAELRPLSDQPRLTAESAVAALHEERRTQQALIGRLGDGAAPPIAEAWAATDEAGELAPDELD